jgi:hypothetical protein
MGGKSSTRDSSDGKRLFHELNQDLIGIAEPASGEGRKKDSRPSGERMGIGSAAEGEEEEEVEASHGTDQDGRKWENIDRVGRASGRTIRAEGASAAMSILG